MKPVDVRKARKALRQKGFTIEEEERDHKYLFYEHGGRRTGWRVKFSHGSRQILQREMRASAFHLGVEADDFEKILDCTHDAAWVAAAYARSAAELRDGA